MHRDIKPENILIEGMDENKNLIVKLADFGFASYFNNRDMLTEPMGSPLYMSPEVIKN